MKAIVNKIIPFSSVDGPGNRTAIFLQGCNIDCKYCHNPETRNMCINCGKCVAECKTGALSLGKDGKVVYDEEKCVGCDMCIKICPNGSSPKTKLMTASDVMDVVSKQIPFISGISVSGGECMQNSDFLCDLFKKAKDKDLSTLIDTNGTILFRDKASLLEVTDGVMLDIKAFASDDHKNVTGYENKNVIENFKYLSSINKIEEIRCVICPDLYDITTNMTNLAEFIAKYYKKNKFLVKLIKYRRIGVRDKYKNLRVPSDDDMIALKDILNMYEIDNVVII